MIEKFEWGKETHERKEWKSISDLRNEVKESKDKPRELNDVMKAADFKKFMNAGGEQPEGRIQLWHRVGLSRLEERNLYNNWEAAKPQLDMVNDKLDINKFWAFFRKYYLDKDPADIKWFQKCLNKMIDGYKRNGRGFEYVGGNEIVRVHDEYDGKHNKRKGLHAFLEEQQALYPHAKLSLEDWDGKTGYIREDGKLGPQTYAVLLFFKSQYLKEKSSGISGAVATKPRESWRVREISQRWYEKKK